MFSSGVKFLFEKCKLI
jgi:hypothetical protein